MNKNKKNNFYILLPLLISVFIVPLIVRLNVINYDLQGDLFEAQQNPICDVFSYNKSMIIIFNAILCILIFIYTKFRAKIKYKKHYLLYFSILYIVFIILSWIFSNYKFTSTWGYLDRYEGSLVLLSYIILFVYTFYYVSSETHYKYIIGALIISSIILNIIGLSQLIGYDFIKSDFFREIFLIPRKYSDSINKITFTFKNNEVYQTLYNINYVGSYLCLVIPFSFLIFLLSDNLKLKICCALLYILYLVNLIGAKSGGGIYAFIAMILLIIVLINKRLIHRWKESTILICLTAMIFLSFSNIIKTEVTSSIKTTYEKSKLQNIKIDEGNLYIYYNDICIKSLLEEEDSNLSLSFFIDNIRTTLTKKNDAFTFSDERLINLTLKTKDNILYFNIDNQNWDFKITPTGIVYINYAGKLDTIVEAKSIGFKGYETFGNSRGYIWSRTFPLLLDKFLIGSGADTYIYQFPHKDYVKKVLANIPLNAAVDKPHNMFLGMAVNTGTLSLLNMIILITFYFINSYKIYSMHPSNSVTHIIGLCIFVGIFGYMITGLVNDSVVSIAPIFWILLGIGFSCNYNIKKQLLKN